MALRQWRGPSGYHIEQEPRQGPVPLVGRNLIQNPFEIRYETTTDGVWSSNFSLGSEAA